MTLDYIMQVEGEEQLQEDIQQQQEQVVSENTSSEGPTRKHLSLTLQSSSPSSQIRMGLMLLFIYFLFMQLVYTCPLINHMNSGLTILF